MSGWVIVTGPPASICRRNSGTTDPDEPSTLPKRTIENIVRAPLRRAAAWKISSAARLEAPITLVGRTALSVEIRTQVSTSASSAARGDDQRAEDVVEQALLHVRFDDRHVLVGGGVIDRLDADARAASRGSRRSSSTEPRQATSSIPGQLSRSSCSMV